MSNLKTQVFPISNFINEKKIVKSYFFIFLGLLLIVFPVALQAVEKDLSMQRIKSDEKIEATQQMTQKQINELIGEDPYLGQTSYLQSPDGFSQRDKSK